MQPQSKGGQNLLRGFLARPILDTLDLGIADAGQVRELPLAIPPFRPQSLDQAADFRFHGTSLHHRYRLATPMNEIFLDFCEYLLTSSNTGANMVTPFDRLVRL